MTLKKKNGFTLLELVFVLVIMGILLSMAVISGRTFMDRYKVESQIRTMNIDFMNARASAMQRNKTYFVTLTTTEYVIYEDTTDAAGTQVPDGDGTLQTATDRQVMKKDLSSYAMTWNDLSNIVFDTKGLMSGSERTGYTTNRFGAAYDCIVVSSTRIRIGGWNGSSCDMR